MAHTSLRKKEKRRVDELQQSRWRMRVLWTAGILVSLVVLVVLIRLGYSYQWTGFGQSKVNGDIHPSKTLWDWLKLLIVPAVLAIGGYLFTRSENQRALQTAQQQRDVDRELAEQGTETDRHIAEQHRQDDTLQAYLDGMAQLLSDNDRSLYGTQSGDSLRTLARARTLTVLARLDGDRKRSVVRFLYESGLIGTSAEEKESIVSLRGADLSGADLNGLILNHAILRHTNLRGTDLALAWLNGGDIRWADLTGANLNHANLRNTDLTHARLKSAQMILVDLRGANLSDANLADANIRGGGDLATFLRANELFWREPTQEKDGKDYMGSDLRSAILRNAILNNAKLTNANLSNADLTDAQLPNADLTYAKGVTNEELEEQALFLEGATMPDGQKYEDWLKDRENRKEGAENGGPS